MKITINILWLKKILKVVLQMTLKDYFILNMQSYGQWDIDYISLTNQGFFKFLRLKVGGSRGHVEFSHSETMLILNPYCAVISWDKSVIDGSF